LAETASSSVTSASSIGIRSFCIAAIRFCISSGVLSSTALPADCRKTRHRLGLFAGEGLRYTSMYSGRIFSQLSDWRMIWLLRDWMRSASARCSECSLRRRPPAARTAVAAWLPLRHDRIEHALRARCLSRRSMSASDGGAACAPVASSRQAINVSQDRGGNAHMRIWISNEAGVCRWTRKPVG
jgi:hypothetical protein